MDEGLEHCPSSCVSFMKGRRERKGIIPITQQHPLPTFMVQLLVTYHLLQEQIGKQLKMSQTANVLQHGICVSAVGSGFRGTSWEMPNSVASSRIPGPCLSLLSFHFTAQKHAPVFLQYATPRQSLSVHTSATLREEERQVRGSSSAWCVWLQCFSWLLSDFTASANTSPLPNRWNCFSIRDL